MKAPKFDHEQWLWDQASECSKVWFRAMSLDNYAELYLWHKSGGLAVLKDKPGPEWELSSGERLRCGGLTREQVMYKIHDLARRLPCLPAQAS